MNSIIKIYPIVILIIVILTAINVMEVTAQVENIKSSELTFEGIPMRSGGSYIDNLTIGEDYPSDKDLGSNFSPGHKTDNSVVSFKGFNFSDNATENSGRVFIPPDPIGAAGTDRLIAVVNVMIEARDKSGTSLWRDALRDFFSPLAPTTYTFDPKVIYDHYENRFLVVALEKVDTAGVNPSPDNVSRILLAVSKDDRPNSSGSSDWYYHAIDGKILYQSEEYWADYPGFEVDEEAVYLTMGLFTFDGGSENFLMRLWIIDKNGFYSGGPISAVRYSPYDETGISNLQTMTMPAQVYGAGGVGPGIGTFLVSYSGLTEGGAGGREFINVIRIDNPLTSPSFHQNYVSLGDISDVGGNFGFPELEDAPQLGSTIPIEVNDTRALDCVWRDNSLWLVTTINPNSGPDAGQTTAHWIQLSTATVPGGPPTLLDQGDIGGEDIAENAFTFFPSVAVNSKGKAKFGFSASAFSIYVGAYVTGREPTDPPETVQSSQIVQAGEDFYVRTFGTPGTDRNRWGDYSGISVDPTDDDLFWIFNGYAELRGNQSGSEDGRWGTAWSTSSFEPVGIAEDSQKQFRQFTLYPNYPNPFNQSTTIRYRLASSAWVSIKIYSHSGEEIRTLVNQVQSAGGKSVRWNGLDNSGMAVASGIYLYEIRSGQFREANRMLLLK